VSLATPTPSTCCGGNGCLNCNDSGLAADQPTCTFHLGDESWHGGPGWYFVDDDYPDEGSAGAFGTREDAEKAATECGYYVAPNTNGAG
jgi:hypothetical protein